jgi:hypothetical protein
MKTRMPESPLVEIAGPVRLHAGRAKQSMLPLVPVLRRIVDPVPRELVHENERCELREPVEALAERTNVMEHPAGDCRVELAVELLELDPTETRALGRLRIDADRVVAGAGKQLDEAALAAAADLEHASRGRRQML